MEAPALVLQHLLAQAVAVAGRGRGVVAGPVGLDGEHLAPGLVGVGAGEIDAVAGDAVLGREGDAATLQPVRDGQLEGVHLRQRTADVLATGRHVLKILVEPIDALCRVGTGIHVAVIERGDERHTLAGARDSHVQPTLAAILVDGPEIVGDLAVRLPAGVADAENDGVTLIALHALDVLHEEPFALLVCFRFEGSENVIELRVAEAALGQRILDSGGVRLTEGDHAQRLVRAFAGVLQNQIDDRLDFLRIGTARGRRIGNPMMANRSVVEGAREGLECTAVQVLVGEGDEPVIAAAVVPLEHLVAQRDRIGNGKD